MRSESELPARSPACHLHFWSPDRTLSSKSREYLISVLVGLSPSFPPPAEEWALQEFKWKVGGEGSDRHSLFILQVISSEFWEICLLCNSDNKRQVVSHDDFHMQRLGSISTGAACAAGI